MAELDYQTALLLQHTFDNELKHIENNDYQIASYLQEEFQKEFEVNNSSDGLPYDKKNNRPPDTKCLTDPSWEVIDPTPNIHILFVTFNERFFWNKLSSVCVSWSKRMTTCAGVCSYQGRNGLCSIRLSEPLLKLRPRKDLIETLLHEMIHAYLFVTHNNRDRDGHGPEFHKHMYRINKESGTNITVYHDFHDEVRLYKQHWWRCDGPCQKWRPFFGMVRRATNRAPGPYDRWWGEHSRNCGGNFIKVKEPDKIEKRPIKVDKVKSKQDIRNFLTKNNVHTLPSNSKNSPAVSSVIPTTSNIVGFKNLNSNSGTKGAVKNGNTIVITKKSTNSSKENVEPSTSNKSESKINNNDYAVVRNHWLNKFPSTAPKRTTEVISIHKAKIPKLDKKNTAECPICRVNIELDIFNIHLDECLEFQNNEQECIICNQKIPKADYEKHVYICSDKNFIDNELNKSFIDLTQDDDSEIICDNEKINCLACGKEILKKDLNTHLDDCLSGVFNVKTEFNDDEASNSNKMYNCPICMKLVPELEMNLHVDECLINTDFS